MCVVQVAIGFVTLAVTVFNATILVKQLRVGRQQVAIAKSANGSGGLLDAR